MRTIQMTLDENLVDTVDMIVQELQTNRSAFAREALKDAVEKYKAKRLEDKHRQGYLKKPVVENEFNIWEDEQDWGGQ